MECTCHLDQKDLQEYVREVFGTGYFIACVMKMHGGAQKVVYKVAAVMDFRAFCMYGISP